MIDETTVGAIKSDYTHSKNVEVDIGVAETLMQGLVWLSNSVRCNQTTFDGVITSETA